MKNVKDEIANQDIENTAKIVKSSMELMEFIKEKEKLLQFAYKQGQIFERSKLNYNFINIVNQFDNSDVINTINEVIVTLKIYEKRKII